MSEKKVIVEGHGKVVNGEAVRVRTHVRSSNRVAKQERKTRTRKPSTNSAVKVTHKSALSQKVDDGVNEKTLKRSRVKRAGLPHLDVLTERERTLVLSTTKEALSVLNENELIDLHDKIRGMRNRYTNQYRRQGARTVAQKGSRGEASFKNQRTDLKAEVFEDALGRVSSQLAVAAKREASRLRKERIEAAKAVKANQVSSRPSRVSGVSKNAAAPGAQSREVRTKRGATPQQKKIAAATRSTQRRNQIRKDSRN